MDLYDHQKAAVKRLDSGKILCGGVGTGKSLTALAFVSEWLYESLPITFKRKIVIITTPKKRDDAEWEREITLSGLKFDDVLVDSWNNIGKYTDVRNTFFIFDEQRVVGSGSWSKAFIKIAKLNPWILLTATPGDTWMDYIPVFIANGFFANRTEFLRRHVIFDRFVKFPKVDRYIREDILERIRDDILVIMSFERNTKRLHRDVILPYDSDMYKQVTKDRFNPYTNSPIMNAAELVSTLRRVVNEDPSRVQRINSLGKSHKRLIIFYNYNYERDALLEGLSKDRPIAEWNGHKHEAIPDGDSWYYIVQYTSGAEGWNCVRTDAMIFYSQNWSYKIMEQSEGRIDRMNTPYATLYYYNFTSDSPIDRHISRVVDNKMAFNARIFASSEGINLD